MSRSSDRWVWCNKVRKVIEVFCTQIEYGFSGWLGRGPHRPWYLSTSRLSPCAIEWLVKLPQRTITLGIKLFSIQLSNIFCSPRRVCGWSSQTSERKKKCSSGSSSRMRAANFAWNAKSILNRLEGYKYVHLLARRLNLFLGNQCDHISIWVYFRKEPVCTTKNLTELSYVIRMEAGL